MTISALPVSPSLAERLSGRPLLLLLDVDGTLAPIAPHPTAAAVPAETRRVLSDLTKVPGVYVAVISGRAAEDAARLTSVGGIWVIGNHGYEIAMPGGVVEPQDGVAPFAERIASAAARADEIVSAYAGAFVEDKHWTFSVHYRLADRAQVEDLVAKVTDLAERADLRATRGKEVVEVRPPLDVDKGTASLALATRLGVVGAHGSLLCAGDDRTDEDAFSALRRAQPRFVTIRVGSDSEPLGAQTAAEFSVPNTEALRALLEWILEQRRKDRSV